MGKNLGYVSLSGIVYLTFKKIKKYKDQKTPTVKK